MFSGCGGNVLVTERQTNKNRVDTDFTETRHNETIGLIV